MNETAKPDRPLTLEQASEFLGCRVSTEAIRKALVAAELRGRNIGGSVGWLTTEGAILEWIHRGNIKTGGGDASKRGE